EAEFPEESLASRLRQFGEFRADPRDPLGQEAQRRKIRLREIAVVVALLLGTRGTHLAPAPIPEHGHLLHALAAVEQGALAPELRLECALDAREGIHVLDLGLRAEACLAARTRAHV